MDFHRCKTCRLPGHAPTSQVWKTPPIIKRIFSDSALLVFLRDKKKKSFLVVAHEDRIIDLSQLALRIRSSRLSFGSKERLFEELGVLPGAVTPLGVINNRKKISTFF